MEYMSYTKDADKWDISKRWKPSLKNKFFRPCFVAYATTPH